MENLTEKQTKKMIEKAKGSWKVFNEWMAGQTCPLIDGKCGYYEYDVARFIRYKCNPKNEPYEEWD